MRVVTGHHHHGQYFLSRASVQPPPELIALVFPNADRDHANLSRGGEYEPSLSGRGFLNLMKHLRTVFLQDSVLLRERHPDHPNFAHPLFQHPLYARFAAEVQAACENPEIPHNEQIQLAAPAIERELMSSGVEQAVHQNRNYHEIKNLRRAVDHNARNTTQTLQYITLKVDALDRKLGNMFIRVPAHTAQLEFQPPPLPEDPQRRPTSPPPAPGWQISPRSPPCDLPTPDVAPQYPMANIRTVFDLWQEWTVGVGKDSVEALNRAYGAAWRKHVNVRNTYSRRKMVIDEIHHIAGTAHRALEEVVQEVENWRLAGPHGPRHLNQVIEWAKAQRKAREGQGGE